MNQTTRVVTAALSGLRQQEAAFGSRSWLALPCSTLMRSVPVLHARFSLYCLPQPVSLSVLPEASFALLMQVSLNFGRAHFVSDVLQELWACEVEYVLSCKAGIFVVAVALLCSSLGATPWPVLHVGLN